MEFFEKLRNKVISERNIANAEEIDFLFEEYKPQDKEEKEILDKAKYTPFIHPGSDINKQ